MVDHEAVQTSDHLQSSVCGGPRPTGTPWALMAMRPPCLPPFFACWHLAQVKQGYGSASQPPAQTPVRGDRGQREWATDGAPYGAVAACLPPPWCLLPALVPRPPCSPLVGPPPWPCGGSAAERPGWATASSVPSSRRSPPADAARAPRAHRRRWLCALLPPCSLFWLVAASGAGWRGGRGEQGRRKGKRGAAAQSYHSRTRRLPRCQLTAGHLGGGPGRLEEVGERPPGTS